jgi:hypothetical protein
MKSNWTLNSGKHDFNTTTLQNKEGWSLYGPDIKKNNTLEKYLHTDVRRAVEEGRHFENGAQNSLTNSSWLQFLSKV